MGRKPVHTIQPGGRYGRLTVLGKGKRNKFGHQLYECRCDCGNVHFYMSSFLRSHDNVRCRACATREIGEMNTVPIIGEHFGCWEVIAEAGRNARGVMHYQCRCLNCGTEATKPSGAIRTNITGKCGNCPPEIRYEVDGTTAIGYLPDGTRFLFDADRLGDISDCFWWLEGDKYLKSATKGYLHHHLLGIGTEVILDHINRDKWDYRLQNLRIVTPQQNATNRSLQRNNTSGFVGVRWYPNSSKYKSEIGLNGKRLALGYYQDIRAAAQAYNIAADILFGEYRGHINDVPEPNCDLLAVIIAKCDGYAATQRKGGAADATRRGKDWCWQAEKTARRKTA